MPTISVFYGIIIRMYFKNKEHNPPHIHAFYGDKVASFFIETGKILEGTFPKRAQKLVREFIKANKNDLMDMWKTGNYRKLKGLE